MTHSLNTTERAQCAALAGLLRASSVWAAWGLMWAALACLAWIGALLWPLKMAVAPWLWGAVGLLGAVERYGFFRLTLDARLFESLARGEIANLAELDRALAALGLRVQSSESPRPLSDRIAGTRRLLLRHALVVVVQTLLMVLSLVVGWK